MHKQHVEYTPTTHLFVECSIEFSGSGEQLVVEERRTIVMARVMHSVDNRQNVVRESRGTQKDKIEQLAAIVVHNIQLLKFE